MSQSATQPETSIHGSVGAIEIPVTLKSQMLAFRNRVWTIKLIESLFIALMIVSLSILTVYILDRLLDTPRTARGFLFLFSVIAWVMLPQALYRWVWKHRRLEQLARLLRIREPQVGDQLLSAIELAADSTEQGRSPTLCIAAIQQVAEVAKKRDLSQAAPTTWLRELSVVLILAATVIAGLSIAFPTAFSNTLERLAFPWRDVPRFTFANIESLQSERVVPHGETSPLRVQLNSTTQSKPKLAHLKIGRLPVLSAPLQPDDSYQFEVPALMETLDASLQVGDYAQSMQFQPHMRPQLSEVMAEVELPSYLQQTTKQQIDVRSGKLVGVEGSRAQIRAVATRELASASHNETALEVSQSNFRTNSIDVNSESQPVDLNWIDKLGLSPSERFQISVQASPDEPPSIIARELPRQMVVMESEQVNFEALASDDFGLKRIGMSWQGLDSTIVATPAVGEKLLAAGGAELTSIQSQAAFCAKDLGISAQPIELKLWAEDYNPDRERVQSSAHIIFVLTADQHAVWIMDQLSKWHKAAIDVRDKEMQLHEENKRLREMSEQELSDDKMRDALRKQAALEASNARRLAALSQNGEKLLKTATRNPEIGVGHLERWAEMLQVLNDIGNTRMPSVSDLLDDASKEKKLARPSENSKKGGPQAGKVRDTASGKPGEKSEPNDKLPPAKTMPSINDRESSLAGNPESENEEEQAAQKKKGNGSKLSLPKTTVAGSGKSKKPGESPEQPEDDSSMDQAIEEQADLLAEFQKIADEMNEVLANLEGSTLVKRLKAASREQVQVAEKITSRLNSTFGSAGKATSEDKEVFKGLTKVEETSRQTVSFIMDDIQAYFERRRMNQFKLVLDDMKDQKVLDALTDLGDAIPKKQGVSIAQAEYWADNLDRWADDLVDPACSGQCPGCKSSDALPPSLILEALRILEAETNLREATRIAEQAKPAQDAKEHAIEANRLANTQDELDERLGNLIQAIIDLPNGDQRFAKDLYLLSESAKAMHDATGLLAKNDTGSTAIAAETEAIEWLLRSKKINPKGGGGGGTDPGGGGTGTTSDSALALIGTGLNAKEKREAREVAQVTGEKARVMPEEFRHGLDQYFNQLEQPNE
ncbi:MAG: hypothetical protein U0930_22040 [Pirellulales bacterium]